MKVTAFVGSGRKGHTFASTEKFLQKLRQYGEIDYEIVNLADYDLRTCRGCSLCLNKGEELCPLKDDRDKLLEKVNASDGIVFATPNYSFNVSGLMKVFLDRFGFVFHRPRYFGKTFTNIVVQGVYGGNRIVKYLNFVGNAMGTNVRGSCLLSREPITGSTKRKNEKIMDKHSRRYYRQLIRQGLPNPSIFELMIFRMSRTGIKRKLNEEFKDYTYYREQGWFESDFYYPVRLNFAQKALGHMFDRIRM